MTQTVESPALLRFLYFIFLRNLCKSLTLYPEIKPSYIKQLPMKRLFLLSMLSFFFSQTAILGQSDAAASSETSASESEEGTENLWKTLSRITYTKEYDEFLGFKIDKPVFGESVQALEGKEVSVRGYIIPVEGYKSHTEFIFSAYPYNMCFFCGGAGPETVMEVEASEPVEYTAEQVVLKGKLQLNADDINRLMYVLVDATMVSE